MDDSDAHWTPHTHGGPAAAASNNSKQAQNGGSGLRSRKGATGSDESDDSDDSSLPLLVPADTQFVDPKLTLEAEVRRAKLSRYSLCNCCCCAANRLSWEQSVRLLTERVFVPLGFSVESVSRLPYLSQGDTRASFYVLDDAVFVLSNRDVQ